VCYSVLQCVTVFCSVLQHASRHCVNISQKSAPKLFDIVQCVAGVLQCVTVCYSVLQCVAARESALCRHFSKVSHTVIWQCVAVCVLQCVCCNMLQCVA